MLGTYEKMQQKTAGPSFFPVTLQLITQMEVTKNPWKTLMKPTKKGPVTPKKYIYLGEITIFTNFFQMDWNHQPDEIYAEIRPPWLDFNQSRVRFFFRVAPFGGSAGAGHPPGFGPNLTASGGWGCLARHIPSFVEFLRSFFCSGFCCGPLKKGLDRQGGYVNLTWHSRLLDFFLILYTEGKVLYFFWFPTSLEGNLKKVRLFWPQDLEYMPFLFLYGRVWSFEVAVE